MRSPGPVRSCCSRTTTTSTGRSTRTSPAGTDRRSTGSPIGQRVSGRMRLAGAGPLGRRRRSEGGARSMGEALPRPTRTGRLCVDGLRESVQGSRLPAHRSASALSQRWVRPAETAGLVAIVFRVGTTRSCHWGQAQLSYAPEPRRSSRSRATTGRPKAALCLEKSRRRPTLPGPCEPSTIGAEGLNCSVRNGKRCFPLAVATGKRRETEASSPVLQNCTAPQRVSHAPSWSGSKKSVKPSTN
jgi:hypothetical protein